MKIIIHKIQTTHRAGRRYLKKFHIVVRTRNSMAFRIFHIFTSPQRIRVYEGFLCGAQATPHYRK